MTVLEKAYCCGQLRTGVGLIGWLGTIITSIILFYFISFICGGTTWDTDLLPSFYVLRDKLTIWQILVVFSKWSYYFCASFLLIMGALKKKELLLLPWMAVFFLDIILLSYKVVYMGFAGQPLNIFIIYITLLFLMLYNWLIVYSYYQERQFVKSHSSYYQMNTSTAVYKHKK